MSEKKHTVALNITGREFPISYQSKGGNHYLQVCNFRHCPKCTTVDNKNMIFYHPS